MAGLYVATLPFNVTVPCAGCVEIVIDVNTPETLPARSIGTAVLNGTDTVRAVTTGGPGGETVIVNVCVGDAPPRPRPTNVRESVPKNPGLGV
jgi:hypothetical protein